MEVPYEIQAQEDNEVLGMDLVTKRSHKSDTTNKPISPTNSDTSCVSNESSSDSNNFDYLTSLSNVTNNVTTNGETTNVVASTDVIEEEPAKSVETFAQVQEKSEKFEGIQDEKHQAAGSIGVSLHQNGGIVVHSLRENNGGVKEMDVGSNGFDFSRSQDTAVGLKYVESLVDQATEHKPAVEVYEVVERVIQNQKTHDLYCPNCSSCITERVILRRRKRKSPEPSTNLENQLPPLVDDAPGPQVDAMSCFSCFSIFIPNGEGFLSWRFKPTVDVNRHPDGTSTGAEHAEGSKTNDTGSIFPLWVVTCCQPAEKEPETSHQAQPPLSTSNNLPLSSTPGSLGTENSTGLPLIDGPQHEAGRPGTPLQNKPLFPINPNKETPLLKTPSPPLATDEGSNFPLWFLTCCQPSVGGQTTVHQEKPDGTESLQDTPFAQPGATKLDHQVTPDGTVLEREPPPVLSGSTKPPPAPYDDTPIPSLKPEPPAIYVPDSGTSPSKPRPPVSSDNDISLPPKTGSSASPGSSAVLPMHPISQPPVIPHSPGVGTSEDVEVGLIPERTRRGVSGLDIIKAIVYGGLLESITSLSVISSAAGGDATTLNIVALGLANLFGGLIVLVHNLRVLSHEHTRERYESQLGKPGHYMLHAVVAIISYLIFGLMSPIIYGFTFRKSDNKDYKLATLAGAALACITILSAAKAYVRDAPKGYIKTIFYYISLGFMVSGLGYVAGDVINTLLKKLGVFDPRAPVNVPELAIGVMNGAWSSY